MGPGEGAGEKKKKTKHLTLGETLCKVRLRLKKKKFQVQVVEMGRLAKRDFSTAPPPEAASLQRGSGRLTRRVLSALSAFGEVIC